MDRPHGPSLDSEQAGLMNRASAVIELYIIVPLVKKLNLFGHY